MEKKRLSLLTQFHSVFSTVGEVRNNSCVQLDIMTYNFRSSEVIKNHSVINLRKSTFSQAHLNVKT